MSKIKNYPLASATRRILSKLCGYLLMVIFNIGLTIAMTFFTLDNTFSKVIDGQSWLFSLMLFISILISIFFWWLYFILLPILVKGQTLFDKLFKLRFYWPEKNGIYKRLLNHEAPVIVGIYFSNLLISLISFAFNDPLIFITNTFSMNSISGVQSGIQIASSVMITVYVLSCFPLIGVIANIAMNSNTTTFLDESNEIYVIHLIENDKNCANENIKNTQVLPGDIDDEELEKLV